MTSHTLFNGDSIYLSDYIDKNSIDLIVTSPPYNLGKEYEVDVSFDDHLNMINNVLSECEKVLKPNHVICWNIAHSPQKNVPLWHGMLLEKHFTFLDDIIWSKKSANSRRFGNYVQYRQYYPNLCWEHIFVYSKGKPRIKVDNSDMDWALRWRNDVWHDIKPENRDLSHPVPFPEDLVEPIIRLYTCNGDTVLDPFCGSGTTMKVARDLDRNSIGVERDQDYCEVIMNRVGFKQGSLFGDTEYKFVVV